MHPGCRGEGARESRIVMKVHKLTAGDGYTYLTRQVAAPDATHRGRSGLGAYYTEKGEAPGVWMGRRSECWTRRGFRFSAWRARHRGTDASLLFGEGRHPNAARSSGPPAAAGKSEREDRPGQHAGLRPTRSTRTPTSSGLAAPRRSPTSNSRAGLPRDWPVEAERARRDPQPRSRARCSVETYGREPIDARELSGHLARISRQATTAVAGYDLTFSPVKSVSTLWAIAPREVGEVIEQAHRDAVTDTLTWIEDNAAYTRRGRNGVAQVDVKGSSRPRSPTATRAPATRTCTPTSRSATRCRPLTAPGSPSTGGRSTRTTSPPPSGTTPASRRCSSNASASSFADREPTGRSTEGKHPIREIVGIDGDLPRHWSKRRAQIDLRRAALSAHFQQRHGRPPTPKEAGELAQQATLETRQAQARTPLLRRAARHLARRSDHGVRRRDHAARLPARRPAPARHAAANAACGSPIGGAEHAEEVLLGQVGRTVAGRRGAEPARGLAGEPRPRRGRTARPRRRHPPPPTSTPRSTPSCARRWPRPCRCRWTPTTGCRRGHTRRFCAARDGSSVYTVAGTRLYTSTAVVQAEQAILAAAAQRGGRDSPTRRSTSRCSNRPPTASPSTPARCNSSASSPPPVPASNSPSPPPAPARPPPCGSLSAPGPAPAAPSSASPRPPPPPPCCARRSAPAPTPSPSCIVRPRRTDPHRFADPAPTSTSRSPNAHAAQRAGARFDPAVKAWYAPDGDGAARRRRATGPLARLAHHRRPQHARRHRRGRHGRHPRPGRGDRVRARPRRIGAPHRRRPATRRDRRRRRAARHRRPRRRGHPVAGHAVHPPRRHPTPAHRTTPKAPPRSRCATATPPRSPTTSTTAASTSATSPPAPTTPTTAWRADRPPAATRIMLAPTRDLVTELNARARADRLADEPTPQDGRSTRHRASRAARRRLACSAGDTIISRQNNRTIPLARTDWVKNGDRWTVDAVLESGALEVTHLRTRSGTSPCPPATSPSTSHSATPAPSTAPKASPPTPATPSPPARSPASCSTSR